MIRLRSDPAILGWFQHLSNFPLTEFRSISLRSLISIFRFRKSAWADSFPFRTGQFSSRGTTFPLLLSFLIFFLPILLQAQDGPTIGYGFRTLEVNLLYSNPHGQFSESVPNAQSGFSRAGGGFSAAATAQRFGPNFNAGAGIEIASHWMRVHHLALREELDAAFATPFAYGTTYLPEQQNWKFFTASVGPVLGYRIRKATIEGRLMFGILAAGNPYYVTDLGTYIPPGYERFFYSRNNETGADMRRPHFAFTPKMGLHLPLGERVILQLNGSLLMANLKQEMEIIDTSVQSGVTIFDRRQATFRQKVMIGTIGAGIAVRYY